jgi:hypothetical protein
VSADSPAAALLALAAALSSYDRQSADPFGDRISVVQDDPGSHDPNHPGHVSPGPCDDQSCPLCWTQDERKYRR